MALVHLASRLYGMPLLIARAKLDVILAVLGPRTGLADMAIPMAQLPLRSVAANPQPTIAVIPVYGTLVRRVMGLDALSGLTAYADIAEQLDTALANPQVKGILLELDSPGGEAGGVFELASRIRAASSIKPVWAHANDSAFSAAYALAAGASRLTLSQTAGIGSIGVIALHVDQSIKDARDGIAYNAIFAGHHKNDFSPHAPLTPQAAASLQAEVDRLYGIFVTQVAELRGLTPEAVRATEAGLLFGEDAINAGLADAMGGMDDITAEFSRFLHTRKPVSTGIRATTPIPTTTLESPMTTPAQPPLTSPGNPVPEAQPPATPPLSDPHSVAASATTLASSITTPPGHSDAQAIAEICLIAGSAHRTAEFLASGLSQGQVRQTLLNTRATQSDNQAIASHITVDAAVQPLPGSNPVMAAMKKLITRG